VLEVCRPNTSDKNIFLEVNFPSGFLFSKMFSRPHEVQYKLNSYTRRENIYNFQMIIHTCFPVSDELFLSLGDCWNILAYRTSKVYFEKPMSDKRPFGRVTLKINSRTILNYLPGVTTFEVLNLIQLICFCIT